jgi:predicted Zn-dependent protease
MIRKLLLSAALLFLALGPIAAQAWGRNKLDDLSKIGKRNVAHKSIISAEKEIEIGKAYAAELDKKLTLIDDPRVEQYVTAVANKVAKNSDLKIPLTVKIFDSRESKALTLPGGYIYISSSLIQSLDDEGQLAGVLAYGIADLAARHWAARQTKATILQYAMVPLIFTPSTYGVYYGVTAAYMNGLPLSFMKFAREDAVESDYLALEYLYKAGYAPQAYVSYLEKVGKAEDAQPKPAPPAFRGAPPARERIKSCEKEIARILPPRALPARDNSAFDAVKALLAEPPATLQSPR